MTTYIDYTHIPKASPPPLTFEDGLPTRSKKRHKVKPEEILVVTPDRNEVKRDYTGAFRPESIRFCDTHGIPRNEILKVDISKPFRERADQIIQCAEEVEPKIVAIFCHGYAEGIQLGFRSPDHRRSRKPDKDRFHALMDVLSIHENVSLELYACSTGDDPDEYPDTSPGSGEGCFADLIRDNLCERGAKTCRVFAHVTAGHTTKNPHIKFFDGNHSSTGGSGATYLCRPGTRAFRKLARMLRSDDFRFRIPFLSTVRIHELIDSVA